MTQFTAHTGAMSGWQQQLGDVSTDASNLLNGAPGVSGVQNSHGTIGHPMQTAFDAAQSARGSAVGATQGASTKIADLLRQAAQAYDRGDMAAAGQLKAQADQMEGTGSPAAGSPGGGAGGGSQAATQMMSQFGQMAGQMAQSITQPIQGLTQSLGQIPQQVFQGVQGLVGSAAEGAGGMGGAEAAGAGAGSGAGEGPGQAPVSEGVMSEERMREMQGKAEDIQPMTEEPERGADAERPTINPRDL
ncbi:ESX-1 secretion-associated protein [Mycobacterium sp. 21AC1]|uniref:ESX-1 secretion-associated protein n=1 Tax=[Mycobacterium] appelbergii TaxID=2939269 RepID=UPI0029390703|nr:ESX-1 secretion-associated protein [Mycobacterium sp. 21AC1]MDV3124364.1 ESX-1 secretion-associated protein [Mycobacterium sp. 21AC1]